MGNLLDFKKWNSINEAENGKLPDSDLAPIPILKGRKAKHKLNPEAAKAYAEMVSAAEKDGITWGITDSYRPFEVQDRIFDWDLFKRTGRKKKKGTGGKITVAYPGTSNHGWGSAVDLIVDKGDPAHTWLTQNASRFGFSPLKSEPWHWEHKGSANKLKKGAKLDPTQITPIIGGEQDQYEPGEELKDLGDGSKIYHEEDGDPYYYQVRDGIWWTIGPRIPEWSSLEQNKEANDILDARYPDARSKQDVLTNTRKYTREVIPSKFDPSKMRAGKIGTTITAFKDFKNKIFTPQTGKNCTITLPGDPLQGTKKTGPVPVIVFYPGIKVNGKIGRDYMPALIKQAVPDWFDKYVIVIPNEHNTRWSDVKKEIQETLKEAGIIQKNLSLGIFSGSGSRGTDISRNILAMNLKNLILMDPTPGKDLINAVNNLPDTTNIVMEYNPNNWGSQRWYTDYINDLVSGVSKKGKVYDTGSNSNDHMNIPSDILIRNKKEIEENLK